MLKCSGHCEKAKASEWVWKAAQYKDGRDKKTAVNFDVI
jgi:hypothetical protein